MQFDEPNWISQGSRNHKVFETLLTFIRHASSEPMGARFAAESMASDLRSMATEQPTMAQYRVEMRTLFGILITSVKQVPSSSPQHRSFVELILSLLQQPPPSTVAKELDPRDVDTINLDQLNNVLAGFDRDAPLHPPLEERGFYFTPPRERPLWRKEVGQYLASEEWTNIHAFLAKLHATAPDLPKMDLRALCYDRGPGTATDLQST